jgi:ligand-binding sensor domain-containing protein
VRNLLVDATGRLFAATNQGLKYSDGDSLLTEQSGQWIGDVGQALSQGVFAGGWDVPLLRFDGSRWTEVDVTGDGRQEGPLRRLICLDGCARYLWVGTWGAGIYRFDGKEWRRFTSRDALGDNHCDGLVAADGKALVSYEFNGIDWYDGRRWRYYNDQNGLLDGSVQAIAIDRQGRPWVATEERSLGCLLGDEWATALINKPIRSLAVHPDGTLWLADDGGQVTVLQVK